MKKIKIWFKRNWEHRTEWKGHAKKGTLPSFLSFSLGCVLASIAQNFFYIFLPFIFYIGVLFGYEVHQWDLSGLNKEKLTYFFNYKLIDSIGDILFGSYINIFGIIFLMIARHFY